MLLKHYNGLLIKGNILMPNLGTYLLTVAIRINSSLNTTWFLKMLRYPFCRERNKFFIAPMLYNKEELLEGLTVHMASEILHCLLLLILFGYFLVFPQKPLFFTRSLEFRGPTSFGPWLSFSSIVFSLCLLH